MQNSLLMAVLETRKQLLHIALDLYRKHPKHSDGLHQVVKLILNFFVQSNGELLTSL